MIENGIVINSDITRLAPKPESILRSFFAPTFCAVNPEMPLPSVMIPVRQKVLSFIAAE